MRHEPGKTRFVIPEHVLDRIASSEGKMRKVALAEVERVLADAAPWIAPSVILGLMRVAEASLVIMAAALVYHQHVGIYEPMALTYYGPVVLCAALVLPLLLHMAGAYTIHAAMRLLDQVHRITLALIMVFAAIASVVFFTKLGATYSRVWLAGWFVLSWSSLILFRALFGSLVRRWNKNGQLDRRAVLIGGGERAASLMSALDISGDNDISVIGIFDDRDDARSPRVIAGLPKLGNLEHLVEFARKTRVDLLILTLPLKAEERLLQVLKQLWVLPVDIRLSAYTQKLRYRPRAYSYIGNVPLLDVFDKPLAGWNGVVKLVEDKVIAAALLLILSPLMALIAVSIKLDSRGPALFRQKRYGFNNELIEVFKFRSMYADQCDNTASTLVTKGDPRVTRVGRLIRATSMDELPQLFNVLKGELSLVGPRPHATHAKASNSLYADVVEGYFARHRVKPGITGWAQINGWRGETDTHEKILRRVEHDLYYIENWSVFFDLYILMKTPFALIDTENAY